MDAMETTPEKTDAPPPALTPEQERAARKAQRAAYFGIRPGTPAQGTPDAFLDDEKPPVFHFEMLTATERQTFSDLFVDSKTGTFIDYPKSQRWMFNRKLLPWDGYVDPKGVPYTFKTEGTGVTRQITDETWDVIALPLRADLLTMILQANEVNQAETHGVKP